MARRAIKPNFKFPAVSKVYDPLAIDSYVGTPTFGESTTIISITGAGRTVAGHVSCVGEGIAHKDDAIYLYVDGALLFGPSFEYLNLRLLDERVMSPIWEKSYDASGNCIVGIASGLTFKTSFSLVYYNLSITFDAGDVRAAVFYTPRVVVR